MAGLLNSEYKTCLKPYFPYCGRPYSDSLYRIDMDKLSDTLTEIKVKTYERLSKLVEEMFSASISPWAWAALELKEDYDRALFVYIGYRSCQDGWHNCLDAMAALELLDSSLLIVDDILDHASRRMGRQTIHETWGKGNAMMLAIMLKSVSTFSLVRSSRTNELDSFQIAELLEFFERTHTEMYVGEYLDLEYENKALGDVDIDKYLEVIRRTTGLHFEMAIATGAMLAKAAKEQLKDLSKIAVRLGTILQIRDDFIDYVDAEHIINKPPFGDFLRKKKRLPLLLAYKLFPNEIARLLKSPLDSRSKRELQLIVSEPQLRKKAVEIVERIYSDTDALLERIQSPVSRDLLMQFSNLVRSL